MDNKIYDSTEEGIGYFEGVTNDTKIEGFQSTLERDGIEILQEKKKALVKLFGDVYGLNDLKKDSEKNEFDLINSIKDNKTTPKDFMKDDVHFTGDGKIKDNFDPESSILLSLILIFKPVFKNDGTGEDDNGLFNQGKTALVTAKTAADATDPAPAADVVDKNKYYKNSLQLLIFHYNRKIKYPTLRIKYTGFPASGSMTFTLTGVKNPSYSGKLGTTISTGQVQPQSYPIDIRNPDSESSSKSDYCPVITKYDFAKMLVNSIFSGWAVSSIMYATGSLYGRRNYNYNLGFTAGSIAPRGGTVINVTNDKTAATTA